MRLSNNLAARFPWRGPQRVCRRFLIPQNQENVHGSSRITWRAWNRRCRSGRRDWAGRAGQHQALHQSGGHDNCITACQECSRSCNETFSHCFDQVAQGKKEHATALRLVADCAKFCNLSADMVASSSPLMVYSCGACAEACKACATECDKHEASEMKDCAKACFACEKTCRAMVRSMSGPKHMTDK